MRWSPRRVQCCRKGAAISAGPHRLRANLASLTDLSRRTLRAMRKCDVRTRHRQRLNAVLRTKERDSPSMLMDPRTRSLPRVVLVVIVGTSRGVVAVAGDGGRARGVGSFFFLVRVGCPREPRARPVNSARRAGIYSTPSNSLQHCTSSPRTTFANVDVQQHRS